MRTIALSYAKIFVSRKKFERKPGALIVTLFRTEFNFEIQLSNNRLLVIINYKKIIFKNHSSSSKRHPHILAEIS